MGIFKGAMIFICGAGVGSGVTYIIMKKKCDEQIQKDLEANRRHYQEKLGKLEHEKEVKEYEDMVVGMEYVPNDEEDSVSTVRDYISYDAMSQQEVAERVKEIQDRVVMDSGPKDDYPGEPIVINEEQYAEDELYFDKIEAELYLGDNALVDENEELLNINDTIGYDILEQFLEGNDDVIYIRNANLSTDYLITKVGGEYHSIMGLGGDEN